MKRKGQTKSTANAKKKTTTNSLSEDELASSSVGNNSTPSKNNNNHDDNQRLTIIKIILMKLPIDIITNEIFTFFPCQWLFRVAFLVCKSWYNSVNNFNELIIQTNLNVDTQKNQSFMLCCKEGRFNSAKEFCVKGFDFNHFKLSIPIVNFTALQVLDLSYSKLGDLGINILSQNNSDQLRGLRKFSYRYNSLTHKGLETLCSLPLSKLTVLDLSFNRIGDLGCNVFRNTPFLNSITSLELYDCGIGNQGFLTLVDTNFQSLTFINLRYNKIDHLDCEVFNVETLRTKLPNLQSINLLFNSLDSNQITHLNEMLKR